MVTTSPSTIGGISFKCRDQMPYGCQLTVVDEPVQIGALWKVRVLKSHAETGEIHVETKTAVGRMFVVVGHRRTDDGFVSHQAVPVEKLEQAAEEIERGILEMLRST